MPHPTTLRRLPLSPADNAAIAALALDMRQRDAGLSRSNVGGAWHSKDLTVTPAPLERLWRAIVASVPLALHQAWFVVTPRGGSNKRHKHAQGRLAGAYYAQLPPYPSTLVLYDPLDAIVPEVGALVLLDGSREHSVAENLSDVERIVFAFNADAIA